MNNHNRHLHFSNRIMRLSGSRRRVYFFRLSFQTVKTALRPQTLFATLLMVFLCAGVAAASADTTPEKNIFVKTAQRISGYAKTLATFTKSTSTKEDIFGILNRLRFSWEPKITEKVSLHITYDHEILIHDFAHTSDFSLIRQKNQKNFSFFDADKVITDTDHIYERHLLHRIYVSYDSERLRARFGKQLIDWGRMRFYSPLDLFNQPIPSDIESDERLGFDALNLEFFSSDLSSLNLIYGPGKSETKSSLALKLYKKIKTFDTFLIAGKKEKDRVAGLGFDGYLCGTGFRGEFTYTKSGKERYPRASIGLDYAFNQKTSLILEYFYNGSANGDYAAFSDSLTESRKRLSLEKNLLSCQLTHELTPLLKFETSLIYDANGESALINPQIRYNVRENIDLKIGSQLFVESRGSEFQDANNLYYLEFKLFF